MKKILNKVEVKNVEIEEQRRDSNLQNKQNGIYIFGISLWRISAYFIIYSIIGYIIETIFGIIKYRSIRK